MGSSSAPPYEARCETEGADEVVRLKGRDRNTVVSVATRRGNNAYEFSVNGKNAFWIPDASVAGLASQGPLCGNPFLAPWANRLDEHGFYANGKRYELKPALGNFLLDPLEQPIHGLLLDAADWEAVTVESDSSGAHVTSRLAFHDNDDRLAQFPFPHNIEMTYSLSGTCLAVTLRIENAGDEPMPVSVGFHPYFQLHDSPRDDWSIHIAAGSVWDLNDRFIPTGERIPVAERFPCADSLPLCGEFLDHVFGDLQRDGDGWARFELRGRNERITVCYDESYPVAVVYAPTGEGESFACFEPMSGITNAFNLAHRGIYPDLPTVPASGEWTATYRIEVEGF